MKFQIEQIGRIRSADFDIKPLTVFIGKANTNKTWSAYALYGLLRSLAVNSRGFPYPDTLARCDQLDAAIDSVASRTAQKIVNLLQNGGTDAESFSIEISRAEVFEAAHPIGTNTEFALESGDIASILAVDKTVLNDAKATLSLPTDGFRERGKIRSLAFTWNQQYWSVACVLSSGKPLQRYVFAVSEDKQAEEFLKSQIVAAVRWLAESVFHEVMAFPSERKGLAAIIPFDFLRREIPVGVTGLSQPAMDYLRFLYQSQRIRTKPSHKSTISELLENKVIRGKADFFGTAESPVFGFAAEQGPLVQINASASFVRSMAGLDLYLRNIPDHDVIVIDEPEMNAHPDAQLQLVEVFAMIANQGRHVIVTTHSPYFLDHLNNLIHGASLSERMQDTIEPSLKLRDKRAFISAEKVSAYHFGEDGNVSQLLHDGVIDVDSFSAESDYLANLYADILEVEHGEEG